MILNNEEVQALRKAQLKIACEIRRICEENEIQYFIACGSMLGAVRHGGFIPWDDDMDIAMLQDEYDKFVKIAPSKLSDEFFLDNMDTNPECPIVFSKVRLKNTVFIENKGNENLKHNEIFVDVFPYFYVSNSKIVRKKQQLEMKVLAQIILVKSGYKVWKGENKFKRVKFLPIELLGLIMSKKTLANKLDRLTRKEENTNWICENAGGDYVKWCFPKDVFDGYIEAVFENEKFPILKNYDGYFKQVYGDYMKLPPEEERITHQIIKLDLGKYAPYKE